MSNDPSRVAIPKASDQFVYDWRRDAVVCRYCFSSHPADVYDTAWFVVEGKLEKVTGEKRVWERQRELDGAQVFFDESMAKAHLEAGGDAAAAMLAHGREHGPLADMSDADFAAYVHGRGSPEYNAALRGAG